MRTDAQSSLQRIEQRPAWPFVFLRKANQYQKVLVSDILFLEAGGAYTQVVTARNDRFLISSNLKAVLIRLGHPDFLRISRCHAVNIRHVDSIEERHMLSVAGRSFPIGPAWRESLLAQLPLL